MRIISKIEDLINKGLIWLINACFQFIENHTHPKIKNLYFKLKSTCTYWITTVKNLPRKIFNLFWNKIKIIAPKIKEAIHGLKIKDKLLVFVEYIKSVIKTLTLSNFKIQTIKLYATTSEIISTRLNVMPLGKKWALMFFSISIPIILFSILGVNYSVKNKLAIESKNDYQNTKIVANENEITISTIRAPYFRREYQYIDLDEVHLPVYVSKLSAMKVLVVDVVIEGSNRYIPQYFIQYEHEIRDHLYTHLEPVIPGFPLQTEGKRIIRNKLIMELNSFLKSKHIAGKINAVHIQGIIAD